MQLHPTQDEHVVARGFVIVLYLTHLVRHDADSRGILVDQDVIRSLVRALYEEVL